jgi:hypothetical protein
MDNGSLNHRFLHRTCNRFTILDTNERILFILLQNTYLSPTKKSSKERCLRYIRLS